MAQLAVRYGMHASKHVPSMEGQYPRGGGDYVFSAGNARKVKYHEDNVKDLYAKIGHLSVECDSLSKAFGPWVTNEVGLFNR